MGSLTSRPRVSTGTQTVVTTTPTTTENPSPDNTTSTQTTDDTTSIENEQRSQTANLLLRDRGRFGTILTGFRGLLGTTDKNTGRKTLLGE